MHRRAKTNRPASRQRQVASLSARAATPPPISIQHSPFSISPRLPSSLQPPASGLTLIELLVTIVIMVTVLAGVIPLMSPNNNSRKIREASRQLSSMLAQAQAQAARDGRPAGVAFRELVTGAPGSPTYNGIALEAFMIAEPAPFAGFSEHSRVRVASGAGTYSVSSFAAPLVPLFPKYDGEPLFQIDFVLGMGTTADPIPPGTFRFGDIVHIDGRDYLIADDSDPSTAPNAANADGTLQEIASVACIWINRTVSDAGPQGAKHYTIRRQPANTSDAPLQFPRGIGIDLQASGATGPDGLSDFDSPGKADLTGIMFNADGTLDGLYFGVKHERIDQIFLLLGLIENANNGTQNHLDYNFVDNAIPPGDRDSLPQRRSRINWLNADSRWVAINRAGRVLTAANNTSFDPSLSPYIDNLNGTTDRDRSGEQRQRQLNGLPGGAGARLFAQQMQQEGGR